MNRLKELFRNKSGNLLSVYFTAGYPKLNDTVSIMESVEQGGADIIEIGIPFSDPIADGPTIQESSKNALENGMTMKILFEQISGMREKLSIPVILMGYLNPVIQYGVEKFADQCRECGVDGLILPDMPVYEYEEYYKEIFEERGLSCVFLITPQTDEQRVRDIDRLTDSFIYMVSSSSTTGAKSSLSEDQLSYFNRIRNMNLTNPCLIGFGISNRESFKHVCSHSQGAIIGSAFIDMLAKSKNLSNDIVNFVKDIKGNE